MDEPVVFISYSHDSPAHRKWVVGLATDLRSNGIDAILDVWDLSLGQDIVAFMQTGIQRAARVLMVCSERYVERADNREGGVGYEGLIVTSELVERLDTHKFLPVIRENPDARTPGFLGPRMYIDFRDDDAYDERLKDMLRDLLGVPEIPKPPLGTSPFSTSAPRVAAPRSLSAMGRGEAGESLLDDGWYKSHSEQALEKLGAMEFRAHMELRFGLHSSISKSQAEILSAVRNAGIRTFGWPIAVLLENREEFRPRPMSDGIRAVVDIWGEKSNSGNKSLDYWALRTNGDFYLLQSLFEDKRRGSEIFFNTRIVRVTETLLFAAGLYSHLGVPSDVRVSIRVKHGGFSGRTLTSSSANRHIIPAETTADESEVEIVDSLGDLGTNLVAHVQQILDPMFILFDFKEIPESVFQDIVRRFESGEVS